MYLKYDGSTALESAQNNGVNLWASGAGQTLIGDTLNDVLGGAGGDTLIGGTGDNQYYLSGPGNTIVQGATGVNTVTTWMSYALPDNIQNLSVTGDYLYAEGNALDNLIRVGDSNGMQLYGAAGNNVLVGGAGTDTFIVDGTSGSNAIYGWHAGDQLRLMGGSFQSFAQVQAAMIQQGSDVVLHNGLNNLVLRNATVSQFHASDFLLGLDPSKLGALTFDDEFNSLSLRGASNPTGTWTPMYGDGSAYSALSLGSHTLTGNGELQLYTDPTFAGTSGHPLGLNPFSISNGVLDIHAQTVDAATSAGMWNYAYSSGVITTHQSFAQTYGYFEMRADLPTDVSGAWPAFWLVPADGSWPPELDVMETLSGTPNVDYTTAHSQATGSHTAVGSASLVTSVGGFHTYGVLWTATTLTWFLDGQAVFQTATPADMNKPMYMIANMAVGGWAGTPNFTSADMKIDYIHAYALADGSSTWTSSVVAAPPPTDPTPPPSTPGSSSSDNGSDNSNSSSGGNTGSGGSSNNGGGGGSSSGSPGPGAIKVTDAVYIAATDVTAVTLAGSVQTVTGNDAGDTFNVANNSANHIHGGAGDDTFILGRGGDVVTGGGGADKFVFNETPWTGGHIVDFDPAHDTIDLSGLLARSGYRGGDPIGDGYIKIVADSAGNAQIWSDLDQIAHAGWWLVTTLDHVSVSGLAMQGDVVTAAPTVSPQAVVSATLYTTPAGVTDITLQGAQQTVTGNGAGDTFHSNNTGNHLIGGAGNDTFILGRGGDVATGGGGSDTFVFNETPWAGGHVTDFNPGADTLDLTGLLTHSGYHGSDAAADGYVKIVDAAGGAQVWSNLDSVSPGAGWWLVTSLDGVTASSVHLHGAFISG